MWKLALCVLALAGAAQAEDLADPEVDPLLLGEAPAEQARVPQKGPDKNINYFDIISRAVVDDGVGEVQPPAIGTRGYRPNFFAIGVGDRTPGVGMILEYSWNRIGMAAAASYRNRPGEPKQMYASVQASYRWFPFSVSPYFLVGYGFATNTKSSTGGLLGAGLEAQIYRGWFATAGYTYHQTASRGFTGGAIGWAF